jgi:GDP-D-mannose dehydratase
VSSNLRLDPSYFHSTEVGGGSAGRRDQAREELCWEPRVRIDEFVRRMVDFDPKRARHEKMLSEAAHVFMPRGVAAI